MIYVKTDVQRLEYDIHSLVKAFYPEETVKVISGKNEEADKGIVFDYEIILMDNTPQIIKNNKESGNKKEFFTKEGYRIEIIGTEAEQCENENDRSENGQSENGQSENGNATNIISAKSYEKSDNKTYTLAKEDKNKFKQFLYQTLVKVTGKELPWGNLTGIRPTKIAMTMIENGKTDEEILSFMREAHFVSDGKSSLALEIAHREHELLKPLHIETGYSLYIGIPFCPTRCLYCSFTSNPISAFADKVEQYLDCLEKEMRYVSEAYQDKALDSIYIGGGTPTTLSAKQLERLLSLVEAYFDTTKLLEYTVEAGRADSITREKLEVLHAHHVGRISVNPQTMRDETLKLIGRQHTAEQVREAFALARSVGFDNINMDMILGLPGESEEDVAYTVSEIQKLAPASLTVHSLAVKRASKLKGWIEENGIDRIQNTDATMAVAAEGAKAMGMVPYYLYRQKNMSGNLENVGYAKPGKFGIYNILIMEEVQTIVALGAGSITKRVFPDGRIERCDNVKEIGQYLERIDEMIDRKRKLFE